jgi:hypothetical protein
VNLGCSATNFKPSGKPITFAQTAEKACYYLSLRVFLPPPDEWYVLQHRVAPPQLGIRLVARLLGLLRSFTSVTPVYHLNQDLQLIQCFIFL